MKQKVIMVRNLQLFDEQYLAFEETFQLFVLTMKFLWNTYTMLGCHKNQVALLTRVFKSKTFLAVLLGNIWVLKILNSILEQIKDHWNNGCFFIDLGNV